MIHPDFPCLVLPKGRSVLLTGICIVLAATQRMKVDTSSPIGCCRALLKREMLTYSVSKHYAVAFTDVNVVGRRAEKSFIRRELPS